MSLFKYKREALISPQQQQQQQQQQQSLSLLLLLLLVWEEKVHGRRIKRKDLYFEKKDFNRAQVYMKRNAKPHHPLLQRLLFHPAAEAAAARNSNSSYIYYFINPRSDNSQPRPDI